MFVCYNAECVYLLRCFYNFMRIYANEGGGGRADRGGSYGGGIMAGFNAIAASLYNIIK